MTKLKCHICGRAVGKKFRLLALTTPTDRPIVMHDKCSEQIDKALKGSFVDVQTLP